MLLITHVSSVDHYIDEKKSNTLMAFLLGEMTGFGFGVFFFNRKWKYSILLNLDDRYIIGKTKQNGT